MPKVSVLSTVQAAYADTWNNRGALAVLATPAVVILSLITAVIAWGPPNEFRTRATTVVGIVGLFIFIAPFSVAWLRYLLQASPNADPAEAMRWGTRQRRALGAYIRVMLISVLALLLLTPLAASQAPGPLLIGLVASVAVVVVYARLLMLVPCAAMDHATTIADVWRMTEQNGLRLTGVILLTVLPLLFLAQTIGGSVGGVARAMGAADALSFALIASVLAHAFQFLILGVMLAGLARAFDDLKPKQVPQPV